MSSRQHFGRRTPARARAVPRPTIHLLHWLLATLLAVALLAGLGAGAHASEAQATPAPVPATVAAPPPAAVAPPATLDVPGRGPDAPASFADLAARLLPAVVNISTTQTLKDPERGMEMPQFPPGSPFEDLFKDFLEKQGKNQDMAPRRATALGSGFIIDPSGLVVTNNHVITDADEISVILHDGRAFKAKVVGADSKADLALLRLEDAPSKLPSVPLGNSDLSRVGDWVLAIGNPYGLGGTVTAGIISARSRDINAGPYDDFIQTDAAINKGNSGGPLFNMKGEVIGINTAIFSQTGGSIGIGFSIPSNLAKPVLVDLQKYGRTRRGWLGVRIQTVTDDIADSLGLKDAKGALVASVSPGGPAAKAGLKAGDVITAFDGKAVEEMRRLPRIVAETEIGSEAEVEYWRDGKLRHTQVRVGELKDDDQQETAAKPAEKPHPKPDLGETSLGKLGFSVAAITQPLRDRFQLSADLKGVVVTTVNPDGPAADKGLRPGDVISSLDNEPVKTPAELISRIEHARRDGRHTVLLFVQNGNDMHYLPLKLDDSQK
ncbi:putative periplasmic serine endoprotease DegP-like precursor [mine drainage metagenome]|uniref:Putative periplasmic serine endoprotease DegP-like n=1 Tax=mine drainage metagenome TaxID=410659 RepID=A0A1J5SQD0_9ZZZZ